MRKLFRNRYFWLVVIGVLWAVTMYFRALYPVIHPWQQMWVMWAAAHDVIACSFGIQVGLIFAAAARKEARKDAVRQVDSQTREYEQRVADFAGEVDTMLRENGHDNGRDSPPKPSD